MAFLVGLFFFNVGQASTDTSISSTEINSGSVIGVFFHSVRYIALNAARDVIPQLDIGPVVQKQYNSNFFPMYTYIIGRSLSLAPLLLLDTVLYGVPVYYMCALGSGSLDRFGTFFIFWRFFPSINNSYSITVIIPQQI